MVAQDTLFCSKYKLNFGIKNLDLTTPAVMGILNITPDSFYDGGKYQTNKKIITRIKKMIDEGADIIDIGGYSTRPGAESISEKEELKRVIPVIKLARKHFPQIIISIDTFRSPVAKKAVKEGANIINDISGGTLDKKMFETVGKLNVPYVLMHMKGIPQTMQVNPKYKNVLAEVKKYLKQKIKLLKKSGVVQIIIDPGFGFGKTPEHNYALLKNLYQFKSLGFPIMAGISRKSMINKILKISPEKALNGTTVANTIALMNGADILRVHDVKEAKEAVRVVSYLLKIKG